MRSTPRAGRDRDAIDGRADQGAASSSVSRSRATGSAARVPSRASSRSDFARRPRETFMRCTARHMPTSTIGSCAWRVYELAEMDLSEHHAGREQRAGAMMRAVDAVLAQGRANVLDRVPGGAPPEYLGRRFRGSRGPARARRHHHGDSPVGRWATASPHARRLVPGLPRCAPSRCVAYSATAPSIVPESPLTGAAVRHAPYVDREHLPRRRLTSSSCTRRLRTRRSKYAATMTSASPASTVAMARDSPGRASSGLRQLTSSSSITSSSTSPSRSQAAWIRSRCCPGLANDPPSRSLTCETERCRSHGGSLMLPERYSWR
jgi:hypothetical protein